MFFQLFYLLFLIFIKFQLTILSLHRYTQAATGSMGIVLLDDSNFDVAGMLNAYELIEICSDEVKEIDKDDCKVRLIPG